MHTAQQIQLNGHKALIADHCELADLVATLVKRLDEQDARITELEFLWSEEIIKILAPKSLLLSRQRHIMAELRSERIELQPSAIAFIHSPGYAQDGRHQSPSRPTSPTAAPAAG